jgi:UDPglucose 6-dehydrogenase
VHGVEQHETIAAAVEGADAVVVVTEWAEVGEHDWAAAAGRMRNALVVDGRNMLDPDAMRAAGFAYEGIGRAAAE